MSETDRRTFLHLLGASAAAAALPASIARAMAIPANNAPAHQGRRAHRHPDAGEPLVRSLLRHAARRARLRRSARRHAAQRRSGVVSSRTAPARTTCCRSAPTRRTSACSSSRTRRTTGPDTHAAWNGGEYDQWVPNKGTTTMAYYTRKDIPFHYALADAFTVCDAYHCSLLGPTDPNRYHMWTGWVGNDGSGGGPVIDNAEAGYGWSTYPERLQQAGISWKIYQDVGTGLDRRRLLGLDQRPVHRQLRRQLAAVLPSVPERAQPGSPLADRAHRRHRHLGRAARCSTSSAPTWPATRCRRSPGSSPRKPTPSIRTGRPTTAPGTSRRCSTC